MTVKTFVLLISLFLCFVIPAHASYFQFQGASLMANVVELKVIGPNCTDTHISAAAKVEKLQGLIPGSRFDFVVVTIGVSATKCVNDRILKIYDLKADAADLIAEAIKSLPTQQHNLPIKIRLPFVSLF